LLCRRPHFGGYLPLGKALKVDTAMVQLAAAAKLKPSID
jgi:hypothetical protein